MVCQYEANRIARSSRIGAITQPMYAPALAPSGTMIASAASGPYADEPNPSSPIAGIPSNARSLCAATSSFASRRPRIFSRTATGADLDLGAGEEIEIEIEIGRAHV